MSSFWGALPPEIVYVPCAPVEPGAAEVQVMLRTLPATDGSTTLVLPTYSSADELVQACGDAQPWVAMRSAGVDGLLEGLGAQAVLLDVAFTLPEDAPAD